MGALVVVAGADVVVATTRHRGGCEHFLTKDTKSICQVYDSWPRGSLEIASTAYLARLHCILSTLMHCVNLLSFPSLHLNTPHRIAPYLTRLTLPHPHHTSLFTTSLATHRQFTFQLYPQPPSHQNARSTTSPHNLNKNVFLDTLSLVPTSHVNTLATSTAHTDNNNITTATPLTTLL